MNTSTGEQIREHIEHLMTLTVQYVEDKITRDHVNVFQATVHDMRTEMQQVMAYVLNLEEKINDLQQKNSKLREDMDQAGTIMANLSEANRNLQSSLDNKKRKFWK